MRTILVSFLSLWILKNLHFLKFLLQRPLKWVFLLLRLLELIFKRLHYFDVFLLLLLQHLRALWLYFLDFAFLLWKLVLEWTSVLLKLFHFECHLLLILNSWLLLGGNGDHFFHNLVRLFFLLEQSHVLLRGLVLNLLKLLKVCRFQLVYLLLVLFVIRLYECFDLLLHFLNFLLEKLLFLNILPFFSL